MCGRTCENCGAVTRECEACGWSASDADLSYADKVDAPLTDAEIEALNAALTSGNIPHYRRFRDRT